MANNDYLDYINLDGVEYDIKDNISGYITGITETDVTEALGDISANNVFAGPTSGNADEASFRQLVVDDIPSIPVSKISDFPSTMPPSSHTHGNITDGGDITTTSTIANGDRLVINDESESKVTNSSITFGTSETTFLTNKGTWATPSGTYSLPTASADTLGGIKVGTNLSISDGVLSATDTTYVFDGTYDASTNKAATVSTVTNAINALDGGTIGTGSTTKTITALSQTNGNVSATFSNIAFPVTSVNTKTGAVSLTASDIGALSDTTEIPTATSDLTNDSNFVSDASYVHTDNNFTTTLKDKLDGIAAGATVDDHKWNNVSLNKSLSYNDSAFVPYISSTTQKNAYLLDATSTPTSDAIARYSNTAFLSSTTPAANDSSTKVATTAFVKTAVDNNKSNYNANSSEAGYILNRPFYSETVQNGTINIVSPYNYVNINTDNDNTYEYNFALVDGPDNTFKKDYYEYLESLYGKGYPGPISLFFRNSGVTYTSASGDVSGREGNYRSIYYLTGTDATITIDVFYDGNDSYESSAIIVSPEDLNILNLDYVDLTVTLPNYTETIHKLDNKYLDLSNYMQKGVDYVTAGRKSGTTLGNKATVEGNNNTASGDYSHAEGSYTTASAGYAHAEGYHTTANASYSSHAEGYYTTASGQYGSHAEGYFAIASGKSSHVEGVCTRAVRASQHVVGEYNIADTGGAGPSVRGKYVEIVGNGTADNARSNARTLDWSGNETLAGKLTLGADPTANMEAATKQYVDSKVSTLGTVLNYKGVKATAAALPTSGNTTGDVWIVTADSSEHVWNGTAWEEFGPNIDLSGYVPTSRTVNGKALSANISLTASDVGALSDTTVIPVIKTIENPQISAVNGVFTWTIPASSAGGDMNSNILITIYELSTGAVIYPNVVVNQSSGNVTITINDTASAGTLAAGTYKAVIIG